MASLMSMEDLFYGPPEQTWILPTHGDRSFFREREFSPPRRFYPEDLRPVERYPPHDIRPVMRAPRMPPPPMEGGELRAVERLARVHTVPEPIPVRAGHEEIRPVMEGPVLVKSAMPVPTQVVTAAPPPPVMVHAPAPPPVQVVQKRSVSPPRAIIQHPIELKVPMCCEKCARKVKERLLALEGVDSVVTDQYNQKVTVYGRVDPSRVLNRVKLVKKRSVFWDITVDYSENYRIARQMEDAALAREQTKAAVVREEAAKSVVTPAAPNVVVNLPQHSHGPAVQAILPESQQHMRMPIPRFETPARGFRQEFTHGSRDEMMMRHQRRHTEVY